MDAREIAFSVLMDHRRGGGDVSDLLDTVLRSEQPSAADRSLATELVYGYVRRKLTLEWLIGRYSRRRPPPAIRVLIGLGIYQLLCLDRVPDYAAVSEAVRMSGSVEKGRWSSSVNAILRRVQSERNNLPWPSRSKNLQRFLRIRYSHPPWLVEDLLREHGPCATEEILKSNNRRPKLTIRCNTLKVRPVDLRRLLEKDGVEVGTLDESPLFFHIKSGVPLRELAAFREGLFTVQDVSAGLAVEMLDPRPGEAILDLCAGPGGKTTFLAQRAGDAGEVFALDAGGEKVRMIEENCARMGIRSVRCMQGDGREAAKILGSRLFDKALVDAPCSNTGVLRRRVEARWRMKPAGIRQLSDLQYSLLTAAAGSLKDGGTVVYSTCSILARENEAVVKRFAAVRGVTFSHALMKLLGEHSGDGVYCALLRVKK